MTSPLFDSRRNSFDDIIQALSLARQEHKNVLIEIGGDWCIWCHRLEEFISSHSELAELRARHYVTVKIYIDEADDTNMEFLSRLPQIDGVPHLFVYNNRGLLLCSQDTDSFEEGESYNFELVRAFLVEWSDWRRSPYDALSTEELKQRFEQHMLRNDGTASSA